MKKHLVLVGGGHAHLTALLQCGEVVRAGHRVTLINPSPYQYYSGMGPGLLGGTYRAEETRFHVRKMAEDRGAEFVEDAVSRIDPVERTLRLRSGKHLCYDVVSFNTGSDVAALSGAREHGAVFPVKPISGLIRAREAIGSMLERGGVSIAVVGGGPAGVEIAGNAWRLAQSRGGTGSVSLIAGAGLLKGLPEKVRHFARESLLRRGIEVREDAYVRTIAKQELILEGGERIEADAVFLATGIEPSAMFRDSGLPTGPDNGLLVNRFLQSVAYPEIFGGGDCICFEPQPLAKVGVYAVRQNPILAYNLPAALDNGALKPFSPQRDFLLILNLGNGRGIAAKKGFVWNGRLAFLLKDRIDRMFMRTYQVSGELHKGGSSPSKGA